MNWSMGRTARRIGTFLAGLGLMAPALFPAQIFQYRKAAPEKGHLIRTVPFEKWLKVNYCGPACLAMVLNSWEGTGSFNQQKIADEIFDSESQATYNSELLLYPRIKGFESYSFQGSLEILKDLISKDIPVIVLTKTIKQIAKGHYRVVIGFDDDAGQIIFHDPYFGGRKAMKVKSFMKVWELGKGRNQSRWMMAVVPGHSPFPFPALQNDPLTSINLATAYYRRSDFARSREQWEKVRASLGGDPYALYSLGMVSLRQGRLGEAEAYGPRSRRPGREKRLCPRRPGPGLRQSREDAPGSSIPRPGSPAGPQREVHPRALSSGQGHLHRKGPARRHPK